ncbi:hypothetical protein NYO99_21320 [Pelomonas sp. UHG3]|uniref:Uncharacterized protein n=2 Tax=Roseateles hydrophilus TaxID=2975054 RepID=A0ACC6CGE0_9BURK|nr:hypothetical protein [Pelomonas sp. UHG3]
MMVGQVDLLTGEMLDGAALAVIYPKRKNGFSSTGWVAVSQNPMLELARADLGGEASRVLFFVLAKLDFENWINLNQTDAAQEMGLQRQNFVRGLRKLIELGVVLPGPKVGRNATYRLNPSFGWKGSAKGHNEALAERMKARGMSVVKSDHEAREELEAAGQMRLDSPPVQ